MSIILKLCAHSFKHHWSDIRGYGLIITGAVLGALFIGIYWLELSQGKAVTLSFLNLAFAQLWHVFNMRDKNSTILNNAIEQNRWIWGAIVLCVMLILGALFLGPVAEVMQLSPPSREGWMVVIIMSFIPLLVGQIQKVFAVRYSG